MKSDDGFVNVNPRRINCKERPRVNAPQKSLTESLESDNGFAQSDSTMPRDAQTANIDSEAMLGKNVPRDLGIRHDFVANDPRRTNCKERLRINVLQKNAPLIPIDPTMASSRPDPRMDDGASTAMKGSESMADKNAHRDL